MNRVKISVSVDPILLRAVDRFVESRRGADRSKIMDEALALWAAAQQEAAMEAQFSSDDARPQTEYEDWREVRRAAAQHRAGGC